MITVVAAMGGEVEGDRQALLPGREVAAVEGVGIFRRGEPGILSDGPGLVDVHGRVGAAQIGRNARPRLQEIDAFEIGLAVARLHRDALGRQPRLGAADGLRGRGGFKGYICEVRYAAHGTHYSICERWGAPSLIMIRMLVAADGRQLLRPIILLRGLARKVGDADPPAEPGFGSILPRRHYPVGAVECAGHDLDPGAADAAEA